MLTALASRFSYPLPSSINLQLEIKLQIRIPTGTMITAAGFPELFMPSFALYQGPKGPVWVKGGADSRCSFPMISNMASLICDLGCLVGGGHGRDGPRKRIF